MQNVLSPMPTNHTVDMETLLQATVAAKALANSRRTAEQEIGYYLAVGKAHHILRMDVTSTRVFGAKLKTDMPELILLDSSTRTDSAWLYRAISGLANGDILAVLGVDTLAQLSGTHPSYIRRQYRSAKLAS